MLGVDSMAKDGTGAATAKAKNRVISVAFVRRKVTWRMNASQGYVLINSAAGIPFRPGISNPREHSRNQGTGVRKGAAAWPLIPESWFTYLNRRYQVVSDAVQCASFKMHLKIGQTRSRNANPARTEPEHNQEG